MKNARGTNVNYNLSVYDDDATTTTTAAAAFLLL